MATTFYPTSTASAATLPASFTGTKRLLSLTRGGSAVTQTDNTIASLGGIAGSAQSWGGTTSATDPKTGLVFVSNPLNAVTLLSASTWSANIRALESSTMANYGVGVWAYVISADGSTATRFQRLDATVPAAEIAAVETAQTFTAAVLGASQAIAAGERIALVFGWLGAGGTSASGFTASGFYNGPTAAASGDTFVTFSDTVTEQTATTAPPRTSTVVLQAVKRAANW